MILLEINKKTKIGIFVLEKEEIEANKLNNVRFVIGRVYEQGFLKRGRFNFPYGGGVVNTVALHDSLSDAYVNYNKMHNYPLLILSANKLKTKLYVQSKTRVVASGKEMEEYTTGLFYQQVADIGAHNALGSVGIRNQMLDSFKAHLNSEFGFVSTETDIEPIENSLTEVKDPKHA